ncbi:MULTISPECIES: amidohydrolase [Paenibacillus]|uniref:amidohydrolase n=1 Tax=Paenibacillus TaxID=44249 RepID=UPI00030A4E11|nr:MULTISPECIES: amidohydrolase [Paenibacillus]KKD52688.1 hydrolase [Paenibacillus sp. ICGEB2008]RGL33394.1 amidohydrolase [Paenibacillus polymyxa]UMR37793.1 amidohydrolase [Paenibacillus polymyxa]
MSGSTGTKEQVLEQKLVEIRRHLHRYPELSNEEVETTAYIRRLLKEQDITILDVPLRTGLVAEIGGQQEGPTVALRADIDALPIQEETGLPYASLHPGKMHACGHDFHTASLLGAAALLKQREQKLKGTVRLVFQPAEEKAKGAAQVLDSGALAGVQAIFGLHNKPDLPVGTVGIKEGPLMAAADGFCIEVEGLSTHAAVPHAGIDPIVVSSHIITALQSIVSRSVNPLDSAVISVTKLHSGNAWNIIPDRAHLDGTIRTFDENVRAQVAERFEQVVKGVADAFGTKATIRWIEGPPPVLNDGKLAVIAVQAAEAVGLEVVRPIPSSASEDFGFYQKNVPGVFVFVGTAGSQEWHHPAFDLDERALPGTAKLLASLAESALKSIE